MSTSPNSTSILDHTVESLLDELISGRAVADENGAVFQLRSVESRAALTWYKDHPKTWARNIDRNDLEGLASSLDTPPSSTARGIITTSSATKTTFRLCRMKAHRFAGIHNYGTPSEPPPDFDFVFDKERPMLIIEGKNGSGKTSILSAICWALTGKMFRSQRAPEDVDNTTVSVCVAEDVEEDAANGNSYWKIRPVTPIPPASVLRASANRQLNNDTFVELDFKSTSGQVVSVRRALQSKGAPTVTGLDNLGLSPVSVEVGTTMPGIIPYIRLGESCELSAAVAEMTGLRPLLDLCQHAKKSCDNWFKKALQKEADKDIAAKDVDYNNARAPGSPPPGQPKH